MKSFDYLLSHISQDSKQDEKLSEKPSIQTLIEEPKKMVHAREVVSPKMLEHGKVSIPIEVRALFNQYSVDESKLHKLFLITSDSVSPIYNLHTTMASHAQIQIALLTALENTLMSKSKFSFSIDDVRERCRQRKVYNSDHFNTYFQRSDSLFNEKKGSKNLSLSQEGKEKLANLINSLVKNV
jgi:hypothetical protein